MRAADHSKVWSDASTNLSMKAMGEPSADMTKVYHSLAVFCLAIAQAYREEAERNPE